MVKETARIIAIEQQDNKKVAILECISKSACSSCNNKSSCGVGVVSKSFSDKTHQLTIPYSTGMQVDEFIELNINGRDLITSAILAYLIPIVFFIGSALIAQQFYPLDESKIIFSAFIGGVFAFVCIRLIMNKTMSETKLNKIVQTRIGND